MTVIVSANIGGYDPPQTHTPQADGTPIITLTEQDFPDDPRPAVMIGKEPKLRPWDYTDRPGPWIWIDGAVQVMSPTFAAEAVAAARPGPLAMFPHPARDCVYAEAEEIRRLPRFHGYPAIRQARQYRVQGMPERWGFWASTIIVWVERCDELADRWWYEVNEWGARDQSGLVFALWQLGIRPVDLPYALHRNPWTRWGGHVTPDLELRSPLG